MRSFSEHGRSRGRRHAGLAMIGVLILALPLTALAADGPGTSRSLNPDSGQQSRSTRGRVNDVGDSTLHRPRLTAAGGLRASLCDESRGKRVSRGRVACADVEIAFVRVSDQGAGSDGDGIPDDGEDVRLDIVVVNRTEDAAGQPVDLDGVTLTLRSSDPDVGCLVDARSRYGHLPFGQAVGNDPADPFRFVVGNVGRTSAQQVLQAHLDLGIRAHFTDSAGTRRQVLGLSVPRPIDLDLDLDVLGASPVAGDAACQGGTLSGAICDTSADCPGGVCTLLPATLQPAGGSPLAGRVGFFEGFEGAEREGGRAKAGGPIPETRFEHLPGLNAGGGFLERFVRDTLGRGVLEGLSPGSLPGTFPDIPEGSSAVDGSRCQFNDPQGPNPTGRNESQCREWDGSDWKVTGSKAFTGARALRCGVFSDVGLDTYHTNQLSAAFTPPIHVGFGGGALLSIEQIVSLADDRTFFIPPGGAADRAYVQVVEVDPDTGIPLRGWEKLTAFQNGYRNQGVGPFFINCMFDPYDDLFLRPGINSGASGSGPATPGTVIIPPSPTTENVSSEDDYFDPNDPMRQFGPSSGCFPAFVFAAMGSYNGLDPADAGREEIPGQPGETGAGTWVNSIFSLDAYAGRTIRIRFVLTGIAISPGASWASLFGNDLTGVRGWNLDDVTVSGVTDGPATLVPDLRDPGPGLCTSLMP
ncbi:MAG: hypothetical protein ACE5IK_14125 [Acidobacteriota bacterium]